MSDVEPLRLYSSWRLKLFARYLHAYFARHFHGVRIASDGLPPVLDRATLLYANHPSWWDPLLLVYLSHRVFRPWQLYAPIDATALERYPGFARLGLFGIRSGTLAGTRRFLRVGEALLDAPHCALAVTAQGGFADVRNRPLRLQRGVAALLARHGLAQAIPVAIECAFWNERKPELLIRFGEPVRNAGRSTESVHALLEAALTRELDTLAEQSKARDAHAFATLIQGRTGIGFWQDLPRRLSARFRGRRFDPAHGAIRRDSGP